MFNGKKMNPKRAKVIAELFGIMTAGINNTLAYLAASELNATFTQLGRGKSKAKAFQKSVAMSRNKTTYFPPEQRNGAKERARRLRQGV